MISHIDWRLLVGDQGCIYSELLAIKNFLEVISPDLVRVGARAAGAAVAAPGEVRTGLAVAAVLGLLPTRS